MTGQQQQETLSQELYHLVENMPIARAILQNDSYSLGTIIKNSLPNPSSIINVENIIITKSIGEAFTGGRSTPVYYISCQVIKKQKGGGHSKKKEAPTTINKQRNFVVKLVLMPSANSNNNNNNNTNNNDSDDENIPKHLWIKRESYAVERRFYDCAAPRLRNCTISFDDMSEGKNGLVIPKLLSSDHDGNKSYSAVCFLMNDLRQVGYTLHPDYLSFVQAKYALQWLATFHAIFWGEVITTTSTWRRDLWNRGGFWTTKENNNTSSSGKEKSTTTEVAAEVKVNGLAQQWIKTVKFLENKYPSFINETTTKDLGKRLEATVQIIAEFLSQQSLKPSLGTLLHGDYKAANMFFNADAADDEGGGGDDKNIGDTADDAKIDNKGGAASVAVVDFQFSGLGLGAEDVAYLLFPDARGDFFHVENELLEYYYEELISQLILQQKGGPSTLSFESFHGYYDLSRIDLLRYWIVEKGWAASTAGDAKLIQAIETTMNQLDAGHVLKNKDEVLHSLSMFVQ